MLHDFADGSDGTLPVGGLTMGRHGVLYGTAFLGGSRNCYGFGCGIVFELSPPKPGSTAWTESVIHVFAGGPSLGGGMDGANPAAGLSVGAHGELYGTTYYGIGASGGSIGVGAVFKLSPPASSAVPWTEAVIYAFQGGKDGDYPRPRNCG